MTRLAASRHVGVATAVFVAAASMPYAAGNAQRVGMDEEASRRSTGQLVSCMVASRKQLSEQYLRSTTVAEAAKWRNRLWDNVRCNLPGAPRGPGGTSRMVSMPIDVERGLIAEQLLLNGRVTPSSVPEAPGKYEGRFSEVSGRDPTVDEMADCAAAVDPVRLMALLNSKADTEEEKAAFAALGPVFGQCLVSGAKLKANRLSLRSALAEALYHRAASRGTNSTAGLH